MQKLLRFICILVLTIHLFGGARAGNFETWTFVGGSTHLGNAGFKFHSANFFRNGSNYFLNHTQLSLDFPSEHAISFGIGYKQEYVEFPGLKKWRAEYRPMLHLYYNKNLGSWDFRDRSRWEFRIIEGELMNRYRNQVAFSYNKFEKLTPYISTEFSFYFDPLKYTRQRTLVGVEIPVEKVSLNLFLGHQTDRNLPQKWDNKFMLGIAAGYQF